MLTRRLDMKLGLLFLAAGAVAAAAACSSTQESPLTISATDAGLQPDAEVDAGAADAGVAIPDTPAGARLAWILSMIDGGITTTKDPEIEAQFTNEFLAAVPAASIRPILADEAKRAPHVLAGFEGKQTASFLVAIVGDARGHFLRITVGTSAAQNDKIQSLLFAPGGDLDPALDTWEKLEPRLKALGPSVAYLDADLSTGACVPVRSISPQSSLALGSAFKLWVLAALSKEIGAGTRQWTDTVAINDAWKSLPSGQMQNQPAGTTFTLQKYAEEMIRISDNTATDHLVNTLGRTNVEAALADAGHHDPTQDMPFLTTRELFTLKLMLTSQEQQGYIDADVATKRTLLGTYASRDPRTFVGAWGAPRRIDKLEWFATPEDLCNVMLKLKTFADAPATSQVYSILANNPGLEDTAGLFKYVGFKGGSEPGVLTMTWLLRRRDLSYRVVTLEVNDTTRAVDENEILYVAAAARALAGR